MICVFRMTHSAKRLCRTPLVVSQNNVKVVYSSDPESDQCESNNEEESSDEDNNDNSDDDNDNNNEELMEINEKEDKKETQSKTFDEANCDEALDLTMKSKQNKDKSEDVKQKKPKRGRPKNKHKKEGKSKDSTKKSFRCDYPGCRKTFDTNELLKEHEKETHKTLNVEHRARYERRCKGNLYYKM